MLITGIFGVISPSGKRCCSYQQATRFLLTNAAPTAAHTAIFTGNEVGPFMAVEMVNNVVLCVNSCMCMCVCVCVCGNVTILLLLLVLRCAGSAVAGDARGWSHASVGLVGRSDLVSCVCVTVTTVTVTALRLCCVKFCCVVQVQSVREFRRGGWGSCVRVGERRTCVFVFVSVGRLTDCV